jgi:MFS family permease
VLFSAGRATIHLATMGITMEFCSEDELPTFTALAGTLSGIPVLLAPLLGGWLADTAGFGTLFVVGIVFFFAGWLMMRWGVREPRQESSLPPPAIPSVELAEG